MKSNFALERNDDNTWALYWLSDDDDDLGGELGDCSFSTEPKDPGDQETWRATIAAKPFALPERSKWNGFTFKTAQLAKAAEKAANAAIANTPIEEWEARALAAGWKAPKGWKKQ